jgi:hypothetical protein
MSKPTLLAALVGIGFTKRRAQLIERNFSKLVADGMGPGVVLSDVYSQERLRALLQIAINSELDILPEHELVRLSGKLADDGVLPSLH